MVYSNKYKFRKLRGTVQDSINEERARQNEDFNRKLKNAEDSMKAIYPEEYKKIRSRYFGNGNNLGLIGSQFNYIHDMITRNSDDQMKKYYNELNDYFIKQTGTEPGYMLSGVDVVDEAPDFNALRQKDFDRFYSPTENSDYINTVEKENARNAYLALQNKNGDGTFDHDGYFDYDPNNGLLNTEANYARATGSYNYTPEERKSAATWERAQNSPIITAMEFSPLFPVVAGVKAVAAANAPQASGVDVGMNAAFAALPAVGAGVKAISRLRNINNKAQQSTKLALNLTPESNNISKVYTERVSKLTDAERLGIPKGDRNQYFKNGKVKLMWRGSDPANKYMYKNFDFGKSGSYEVDYFSPQKSYAKIYGEPHLFAVPDDVKTLQFDAKGKNFFNLGNDVSYIPDQKTLETFNNYNDIEKTSLMDLAKSYGINATDEEISALQSAIHNNNTDNIKLSYGEFSKYFYGLDNPRQSLNSMSIASGKPINIMDDKIWDSGHIKEIYENIKVPELSDDISFKSIDGMGNYIARNKTPYDAIEVKNVSDYNDNYNGAIQTQYLLKKNVPRIFIKKYGGIHINPKNEGKFTESANRAGMGVQEYARHILANKENYSPTMVRRANFARNASKWKHADGGDVPPFKSFDDWYRSIYHNANDTTDYNLRRAYELAPIGELEAWRSDPDKNHLHTGYWNGDVYEFMKSKDHPTVNYELDWYNSPDADDFRSRYMLDTTTGNYKYVPRYKVKVTF